MFGNRDGNIHPLPLSLSHHRERERICPSPPAGEGNRVGAKAPHEWGNYIKQILRPRTRASE